MSVINKEVQPYCGACRIKHPTFAIFRNQDWLENDVIPVSSECLLFPLAEEFVARRKGLKLQRQQSYLEHIFEAQRRFGE